MQCTIAESWQAAAFETHGHLHTHSYTKPACHVQLVPSTDMQSSDAVLRGVMSQWTGAFPTQTGLLQAGSWTDVPVAASGVSH